MANPTTNYSWPMPTSADLVTDLPADFAAFGQPVDTSLKALNPETTLGDIAFRSSTSNTNTRLGIGSTSQVLTVVSGVPAWATASSGGMTLLSTTTLSGASTTISSIDQTYTDLKIIIFGIQLNNSGAQDLWVGMNGGYTGTNLISNGSGSTATHGSTGQQWVTQGSPYISTSTTNQWTCFISQYASSTICKIMQFGGFFTGTVATNVVNGVTTNSATTAISSLALKLSSGTTFSAGTVLIYGVK